MPDNSQVTRWIELAKEGDSQAANRIWQRYFDRLVRAVGKRIAGQNRAVADEEDIALSVFHSFYAAAEQGRFTDLTDRDDLWQLLLRMAARKVVDKHRHDNRQRRGGGRQPRSFNHQEGPFSAIEVVGEDPSPDMIMMMQESVDQFFSLLGVGQLKEIAVAKLEGYSNAEIAARCECSERTIERRLHLIREKFQQEKWEKNERSTTKTSDSDS